MTANVNWGAGGKDDEFDPPAPTSRHDRGEPPALQVKAPARAQPSAPAQTGAESGRLEFMLQRMMERIDDSERRYGEALEDLHERLEGMSRQPDAAHRDESRDHDAGLESVEARARNLAERLRQPDTIQNTQRDTDAFRDIEQRISAFAEQMAAPGDPYQGDSHQEARSAESYPAQAGIEPRRPQTEAVPEQSAHAAHGPSLEGFAPAEPDLDAAPINAPTLPGDRELNDLDHRFTHIGEQFEESLAAWASPRPDDPRGEAATEAPKMAPQGAPPADPLTAIEAHLAALSGCSDRAEEQSRRLDSMERHLTHLIEMLQSSGDRLDHAAQMAAQETVRLYGGGSDWTDAAARLDAVQQELHALKDTLRNVASRLELRDSGGGRPSPDFRVDPGQGSPEFQSWSEEPQSHNTGYAASVHPDTRANVESHHAPRHSSHHGAEPSRPSDSGAPPAPIAGGNGHAEAPGHAPQPRGGRPSDHDLVAAARRAAQEAARRSQEQPRRAGLMARLAARGAARPVPADLASEGRKPRRLLVFAAVFLLIVSAALLYGRLQNRPQPPATSTDRQEQTAPPVQQGPQDSGVIAPESGGASQGRSHADNPLERTRTAASDLPRTLAAVGPEVEPDPSLAMPLPGTSVQFKDPAPASRNEAPPAPRARPAKPDPAPDPAAAMLAELPEAIGPITLRKAAAQGDAQAQFEIAARFAAGDAVERDFAQAARWYERAATQAMAPAQFRLASLYERGQGVARDSARAKHWYMRAAEQGNINAMHNLAVMHIGQDGDGPDYAAAARWFERAATHGLADSHFNLGILYENGLGVRKDLLEAYKWFALAAASGDAEADRHGAQVKARLSTGDFEQAETAVRHWSPLAADRKANGPTATTGPQVRAQGAPESEAPRGDAAVQRAQSLLNALGYDAGPADGILGPRTQDAIRAFERRAGFAPTGEVTRDLLSALQAYSG